MHTDQNEMLYNLDEMEIELLKLLIKGMKTSEIAKYLSISYHDAAEVNRSIKRKLNVTSVEQLKKSFSNSTLLSNI